jgi:hypothetical protein
MSSCYSSVARSFLLPSNCGLSHPSRKLNGQLLFAKGLFWDGARPRVPSIAQKS